MAEVRVRMQCVDYGLPDAVIEVGWDSILNYKPDDFFQNYRFSIKNEMFIACNSLPQFTWDVDVEGDPWASFILMDNGCYVFQVSIDLFCGGAWVSDILVAEFSTTEWRINLDEKYVIVKIKASEASLVDFNIECLKKKWNETLNIFDIPERVAVKPYVNTYGFYEYQDIYYGIGSCIEAGIPDIADYCYLEVIEIDDVIPPPPINVQCTFLYHRFERNGTCESGVPVPPDEFSTWNLIDGTCPDPIYWKCPDSDRLPYLFLDGILFRDMIEYLISLTDCGLTVESDFFNINPPGLNPTNSAYDKAFLELQQLVVFQKSDIKRFDSTNRSAKPSWITKIKEVLADLFILFKVKAQVDGSILRLEHISFYESIAGNDYTNEYYIKELQRDNSDTPRLTRFYFRDPQASEYFAGLPIEIYCGEGEAEKRCTQFYTDLLFAIEADNAESIGDDGWFLMATEFNGTDYQVLKDNRPLSFTELHENFHTYDMAGAGTINGVEVVPESIAKTRKQPEFKVKRCCDDDFDPNNYITTSLGQGKIDNADWNLSASELLISAKY